MIIESTEDLEVVKSFDDIGLREELLRGIYAYGYNKPSAVQQRAILPIIKGRDVIVQSQSGTGKTCVFLTGGLQSIDLQLREP
jgi:ATP-dependent RNA helicase